jgi:hypothetical protein
VREEGEIIMKFPKRSFLILLIFLLVFSACESIQEEQREELFLEACAAGILVVPDLMPPPRVTKPFVGADDGMVQGNLVGLFSQATVDAHLLVSDVLSSYQTEGAYNYAPTEGMRIVIEKVFVHPQVIVPGDYLDLNIRYALLSPYSYNWTPITEIRELFYNNEMVGRPEAHVSLLDGTYTTTVRIRLPRDVPVGQYQLVATVQTENALDAKELRFLILTHD